MTGRNRTWRDWLARLGILRYGTKAATYTSGRDRPIEFLMDGVFNAERDLGITDNLNRRACPVCKADIPAGASACPVCDAGAPPVQRP